MRTYLVIGMLVVLPGLAAAQTTSLVADRLAIALDSDLSGDVGHPSYVSQLTKWLINQNGEADFRYLFTDELRAKLFTADLESVLAGSQRVTKSFSLISQAFTCPAASGTSTLWVDDAPTFGDAAIFVSGDAVIIRNQTRTTFGPFTISDCVGVVTAYADGSGANAGQQSWTFTRNAGGNAGAMTASTVVPVDTLVQDMGVTGNGYVETTAVDGAAGVNAPYTQIITWATAPVAANLTVRARLGNLLGITGTAGEYGLLAGTYAATGGQYFRASNSAVELHGVNLLMWDGATNTIKMDRTAPSFALGSSVPTAYGTGTGIWMGKDAGAYKFRVGVPGGSGMFWDGTVLTTAGWNIGPDSITSSAGTVGLSSAVTAGDDVRFFAGNTTPSNAPFLVTEAGALFSSSATITGAITATTGAIGGFTIGASTITGDNLVLSNTGNITVGTGNNVARMSDDGTIRFWAGHATAASAPFQVFQTGAVTASDLTVTGGSADFGTVLLNSSGITIDAGSGSANQVKWTDGSTIYSTADDLVLSAASSLSLNGPSSAQIELTGTYFAAVGSNDGVDLGTSSDPWDNLFVGGTARVATLAGTGTRHVCAEADGDLVECP